MSVILVVDDTALAREAVSRLLEFEGFQTIQRIQRQGSVCDAVFAKTRSGSAGPDDAGNGWHHVHPHVRGHPQWETIPVIVLTGLRDDNQLVSARWNWE